jgi:triosephosphate isomerase
MFKTSLEGAAFVRDLAGLVGALTDRQVMVAPPFTGLCEAAKAAQGTVIGISAQDLFWEWEGAYTGEVSAAMLIDLGVSACIIGHSERRRYFGETDEWVAKKVWAALEHGLLPIMCVGETEEQREAGLTEAVLSEQIPGGLSSARAQDAAGIVIAYEPVWAIGTGKTATPEVAQEAIRFVRQLVGAALGPEAAELVRILYGGSVGPNNIDELMMQPDIDGVLVGGASLQLGSFVRIVQFEKA